MNDETPKGFRRFANSPTTHLLLAVGVLVSGQVLGPECSLLTAAGKNPYLLQLTCALAGAVGEFIGGRIDTILFEKKDVATLQGAIIQALQGLVDTFPNSEEKSALKAFRKAIPSRWKSLPKAALQQSEILQIFAEENSTITGEALIESVAWIKVVGYLCPSQAGKDILAPATQDALAEHFRNHFAEQLQSVLMANASNDGGAHRQLIVLLLSSLRIEQKEQTQEMRALSQDVKEILKRLSPPEENATRPLTFAELCERYKAVLTPYLQYLIDQNSYLDPRGMGKDLRTGALPLDEVYVSLAVERQVQQRSWDRDDVREKDDEPDDRNQLAERDEEDRQHRELLRRSLTETTITEKLTLDQATSRFAKMVIVGDPGSGKTTLLRFLARHFAEAVKSQQPRVVDKENADYGPARLPIFVRIARYAEVIEKKPELALSDYLPTAFADLNCDKKALAECFEAFRHAGHAVILFDGLDEVIDQGDRGRIAGELDQFAHASGNCPVLVTSRVAGYRVAPLGQVFTEFRLLDMTREQIELFLDRYCPTYERAVNPSHTDEQIRAAADAAKNAILEAQKNNLGVQRLARNPLLLTILALVQRNKAHLPHYRIELYRIASEVLLEDWRAKYVGSNECVTEPEALALLGPVALWLHTEKPSGMAPLRDIEDRFAALLAEQRGKNLKDVEIREAVREFLRRVREHTGLFVEKASGYYGFLHLTFEEYFVARQLVADDENLPQFIHQHRHDPRWEEPIRLAISYESRDRPQRATRLIRNGILGQGDGFTPAALEDILHRDLLLAALALGDCLKADYALHHDIAKTLTTLLFDLAKAYRFQPLRELIMIRMAYLQRGSSREEIRTHLVDALKDSTWQVRLAAAQALAGQSSLPASVINALINTLKDNEWQVRLAAAQALAGQSTESAINALINALKDNNRDVRLAAAQALVGQSSLPESVINALINTLKDSEWLVRLAAAQALAGQSSLPESAINALINTLKDSNRDVRLAAAQALAGQSTESAINALINALKDSDEDVRREAAQALAGQSSLPESTINALINAFKDSEWQVRLAAAQALAGQSSLPESAINALINAFKDNAWQVRLAAAQALAGQSSLPECAINALINTLKDSAWLVRREAAQALLQVGRSTESAINALINAFKDSAWQVRLAAAQALVGQSSLPESAINALVNALKDSEWRVRRAAAQALLQAGRSTESAINALINAFKDNAWQVRLAAAQALVGQSSLPESTINALINALKDSEWRVRQEAANALGKMCANKKAKLTKQFVEPLKVEMEQATTDSDNVVRDAAWTALLQAQTRWESMT